MHLYHLFSAKGSPEFYSSRSSSIKTCTNGIRNVGRDTIWHLAADQLVTQTTHFMIQKLHPDLVLFAVAAAEGQKDPISHMGGRGQVMGGHWTKPGGQVVLHIAFYYNDDWYYTIVICGKGTRHIQIAYYNGH